MTISFDLPKNIAERLATGGVDPSAAAKEAALVELYRESKIDHSELAHALGMSRYEADGVLKRHGVLLDVTGEQLFADIQGLRELAKG